MEIDGIDELVEVDGVSWRWYSLINFGGLRDFDDAFLVAEVLFAFSHTFLSSVCARTVESGDWQAVESQRVRTRRIHKIFRRINFPSSISFRISPLLSLLRPPTTSPIQFRVRLPSSTSQSQLPTNVPTPRLRSRLHPRPRYRFHLPYSTPR